MAEARTFIVREFATTKQRWRAYDGRYRWSLHVGGSTVEEAIRAVLTKWPEAECVGLKPLNVLGYDLAKASGARSTG